MSKKRGRVEAIRTGALDIVPKLSEHMGFRSRSGSYESVKSTEWRMLMGPWVDIFIYFQLFVLVVKIELRDETSRWWSVSSRRTTAGDRVDPFNLKRVLFLFMGTMISYKLT